LCAFVFPYVELTDSRFPTFILFSIFPHSLWFS
jgi:hypothetical protein